jgi:hypothetical protein
MNLSKHNAPCARAARLAALFATLATGAAAAGAESATLKLVQTIPLKGAAGRLDHLALDAKGGRLFIANLSNNSLDVVDLMAGALVKQIPGQGKAQGVAYAPDLDRIFVGCGADGACNAFDGRTYRLLHSLKLPGADNVRYEPSTRRVYVTHDDRALTAFDAETFAVKGTAKLPGPPEAFQIDPGRRRLYVNTHDPAQVAEVDADTLEVLAKHPLSRARGNYPLALDPAGRRAFVGCREKPMIVALDLDTDREVAAVDIPGDVDDLFYDAKRKRIYATCGEGFVAVVRRGDGDRYELAEKIPTARLARTGLFEPDGGRLYVVLPRGEGRDGPALRVYQARP